MKKFILSVFALLATSNIICAQSFQKGANGLYLKSPYTLSLGSTSPSTVLFNVELSNSKFTNFLSFKNNLRNSGDENVMSVSNDGLITLNGAKAGLELWQHDGSLSGGMAAHLCLDYRNGSGYTISSLGGGRLADLYYRASKHNFEGNMSVNGTIECKGEFTVAEVKTDNVITKDIKINMNNVADYVFEKDYDLKDLSEVESYVNENKHLPGVPSAAEIEADGVSVSKMTNILLEKVEELTLHMIQLKKENEALKARFQELGK